MKGLISFLDQSRQTVVLVHPRGDEVEPLLDLVLLIHGGEVMTMEETENIRAKYKTNVTGGRQSNSRGGQKPPEVL